MRWELKLIHCGLRIRIHLALNYRFFGCYEHWALHKFKFGFGMDFPGESCSECGGAVRGAENVKEAK